MLPAPSDVVEDDGGLLCSVEVAVVAGDDLVDVACHALASEIACSAVGVVVDFASLFYRRAVSRPPSQRVEE